ncbi:MAG: four helix bundle protein [Clostridia bacterium]|nr:four helix bundle protein [Clostridia bacterium]
MKQDKFKIVNLLKELIVNIDQNLLNFPKKEVELKHKIKESAYNLLLLSYEANNTTDMDKRVEIQERCIAYIKYIDFLFNLCYDKQIINGKKYLKFGEKLDIIVRYLIAWRNATKPEKARNEVLK